MQSLSIGIISCSFIYSFTLRIRFRRMGSLESQRWEAPAVAELSCGQSL